MRLSPKVSRQPCCYQKWNRSVATRTSEERAKVCPKIILPASALFVPSFPHWLRFELVGRDDDARRRCVSTNKLHVHGVRDDPEELFPFSKNDRTSEWDASRRR